MKRGQPNRIFRVPRSDEDDVRHGGKAELWEIESTCLRRPTGLQCDAGAGLVTHS